MSKQQNLVYFTMLVLALITVFSLYQPEQMVDQIVAPSGSYERIIWTDKETYELGEKVEAAIILVNHNEYPISVNPIFAFDFSGNSVYDPEKIACTILANYPAGAKVEISANGNLTLTSCIFTPTYPGPFKINGLGLTKTVNVTGYKKIPLNSTGISFKIEPSNPKPKDKEKIECSLVIVNDNPYPVKVPVFERIGYGLTPGDRVEMAYWDRVISSYRIEANSQCNAWSHSFYVRYPSFSLYVYVDDFTASLSLEVEK